MLNALMWGCAKGGTTQIGVAKRLCFNISLTGSAGSLAVPFGNCCGAGNWWGVGVGLIQLLLSVQSNLNSRSGRCA